MSQITNKSVINQASRICKVLRERGENISQENAATILVRALLEELGELELLNSNEPIDKAERAALVTLAKPFCTASKNWQDSYAAVTNGLDGQPLMPKTAKGESSTPAEFA
jgi:hypothetical protein